MLKARGWATALMAGESGNSFSTVSFFTVRVDLTDEGNAHLQEVQRLKMVAPATIHRHWRFLHASNLLYSISIISVLFRLFLFYTV